MRERPTPETDAAIKDSKGQWSFALKETCQRLERERDQARELAQAFHKDQIILLRERDEAREALSSIHRWIERNHADGFIDSLTYLQNLERVTDCWYDRIDKIERERDEARLDGKIYYNRMRQLGWELYEAREALREIAEASGFDNIGNWARKKARKALEGGK